MASIRKRGENSYLLVVSRGYDYQGNRLKPAQKTVHPPLGLTAKQTQKWLNEQAVLYEQSCCWAGFLRVSQGCHDVVCVVIGVALHFFTVPLRGGAFSCVYAHELA